MSVLLERLSSLMHMERSILERALSQTPTQPLYHYTGQTGFLGIVRDRKIWATHTQYLNDQHEYVHAVEMVRDEIRALLLRTKSTARRAVLEEMESALTGIEDVNVCVCSFSEQRDSLSQWRAYGKEHSSFAVGFSGEFLAAVAKRQGWYLAPCIYKPRKQKQVVRALVKEVYQQNLSWSGLARSELGDLPQGGDLGARLHRYAPILKDFSFRDEGEWRLISTPLSCRLEGYEFREGKSMLIPFYQVPLLDCEDRFLLHEVVVGPTPHSEQSQRSARSFLVKNSQRKVAVVPSNVPYRSW